MDYQKILTLCEQKNISPQDLADKIGITRQGLLKAIKKKSMNINTVEFIAKTLNASMLEFIDDEKWLKLQMENLNFKERISDLQTTSNSFSATNDHLEKQLENLTKAFEEKSNLLSHYQIIIRQYEKKLFPETENHKG